MALSHKTLFALLTMLMSEISEECMCARWQSDLEYILWDAVLDKPLWTRWEQIPLDQRQMMRELSEELGGWVAWDNVDSELRFVPFSEWQAMCAAKAQHWPRGSSQKEGAHANDLQILV